MFITFRRHHHDEAALEGRKAWLNVDSECLECGDALAKAIDIKVAGLDEDGSITRVERDGVVNFDGFQTAVRTRQGIFKW